MMEWTDPARETSSSAFGGAKDMSGVVWKCDSGTRGALTCVGAGPGTLVVAGAGRGAGAGTDVGGVVGGGMIGEVLLVFSITFVRRLIMFEFCVTIVDCCTII